MGLRFLSYSLDDLALNNQIRLPEFGMSARAKATRYPIRALRYWFVCQVLVRELAHKSDATIVDMGAEHGQMRRYCAGSLPHLSPSYPFASQQWIGLDKICHDSVAAAGYRKVINCDFDRPLPIPTASVDALIFIHVLEHLPRPEFSLSEIARVLAPGGILCAGSPTAPEPVSTLLHYWLRRKMRTGRTGPNGHINSHSPQNWRNLISNAGLELDFVSGSHLMRLSGAPFENFRTWTKLNLFWGGLFPSLGSEIYLVARKPR